ncbi:hypothetical protein NC652_035821 [Populus alba x Populus x berolinensis]|nr:hypothetical protein NC652_035821 [Populus alba x Populus x berolinensis]
MLSVCFHDETRRKSKQRKLNLILGTSYIELAARIIQHSISHSTRHGQ